MPKILVFAGSWRPGSMNTRLATLIARNLTDAGAEVTQISLGDYPLPLIDARAFHDEQQQEAKALAGLVDAHDGLFIASPEYNAGYPPALKNALDWVSRTKGAPFRDKPVAIISAADGRGGGDRSQFALRLMLTPFRPRLLTGPEVLVADSSHAFSPEGRLIDPRYQKALGDLMQALRNEASR